jgi:transcriptional regulator of acetoin/glycerol metabolism
MQHEPLKKTVWDRFVNEGVTDPNRIKKRILESWYLCRQSGVNPYDGKGIQILTEQLLSDRKKENDILMEIAMPHLKKVYELIKGTEALLLLADPEGYVLNVQGDRYTTEKARMINFIEGAKWTEEQVGTNAIGTALRINEPITIVGSEHFSVASHQWFCSASPIHDDEGKLIGLIDVSGLIDHGSSCEHILAAVTSTAYAIEYDWIKRLKEEELEILRFIEKLQSTDYAVLCNRKDQIIYSSKNLRHTTSYTSKPILDEFLSDFSVQLRIPIYSSICNRLIGYNIQLQPDIQPGHEKSPPHHQFTFNSVAGKSESFQQVLTMVEKVANTGVPVHIQGETGTGKEIIARTIHTNSSRKDDPFISVNCGAIPEQLIESELFGYVKGAFTGANRTGSKGKLEQANHGTLFLDEIGEIPHHMQVALLRVLQEKQLIRLGGSTPVTLDIRLMTATHRDVKELVNKGIIREDFFYRIFVFPIQLPPLRERKQDIPDFIEYYCQNHQWHVTWPDKTIEQLMNCEWQGNIRELFNVLDRIRILYQHRLPDHIPLHQLIGPVPQNRLSDESSSLSYREQLERDKISLALEKTDGNVSKASKKINMPRSTFYRKIKKYNL